MRALSPLEREVLEEAALDDCPADEWHECDSETAEEAAVSKRLERRGLLAEVPCAKCSRLAEQFGGRDADVSHDQITATGRLALRIDNIARSVTSSC